MGDYESLRLTVVQNCDLLNKISSSVSDSNIFYNAPTVIIISSNETNSINFSNAGCIAENILLSATELEIGSVYIMQAFLAFEKNKDLLKELKIPDNFFPVASVALGYPCGVVDYKTEFVKKKIKVNYI
jgi:nitroreductase